MEHIEYKWGWRDNSTKRLLREALDLALLIFFSSFPFPTSLCLYWFFWLLIQSVNLVETWLNISHNVILCFRSFLLLPSIWRSIFFKFCRTTYPNVEITEYSLIFFDILFLLFFFLLLLFVPCYPLL